MRRTNLVKNVSDFFQKHGVSATNASLFAQHGNKTFDLFSARLLAKKTSRLTMLCNDMSLFATVRLFFAYSHTTITKLILTVTV